ncbi:unnamed protein product, partial [Sphacelaria rigidula]
GGLSKIAWGFLRPIAENGECNVGVRSREIPGPSHGVEQGSPLPHFVTKSGRGSSGSSGSSAGRRSTLQLFKYRPLSMLAKWQARKRGFPRLPPPISPEVPDVYVQFLLDKRERYPATLSVSVQPTHRPTPVWVSRRPTALHERERHQLTFESLAAMHDKSRENRNTDVTSNAARMETGNSWIGGRDARNSANAERVRAARARRLRDKNESCALPDRLLHRIYAGQNGAMTLAFSGSGSLLAVACCDDPLPERFPIRLINSETGRCRHELKGHVSMVYSLAWSHGDNLLLSASADGTAKVWHITSSAGAGAGSCGGGCVRFRNCVCTSVRGDKGEPWLMCTLQHAPPCFVYAAVFQPAALEPGRGVASREGAREQAAQEGGECGLAVTGAFDRRVRLWDISAVAVVGARAKLLGTLSSKVVHESHVNALVYDAKNGRLYSGDGGGDIVVWRRGSSGRGLDDYSVLRKIQHADFVGKAITSLALAPRLRRGQLLVQAHGNTLRLLDLRTYQLVNPGFSGGAAAGSLVRASFSPDGQFVVSGSESGQVRVWEAQEGKRVKTPLQTLGTACSLRDVVWHPHQHVLALAGYGPDAPVLLYYGEARADKQAKGKLHTVHQSLAMTDEAAREATVSAEEHRRRQENRQRLRELRVKRLRAKALGLVDGAAPERNQPGSGIVAALAALTA